MTLAESREMLELPWEGLDAAGESTPEEWYGAQLWRLLIEMQVCCSPNFQLLSKSKSINFI